MRQPHNATLDGLRGVAAGAVVWYHMTQHFGIPTPARGYLAVDFFFVLSGMVIASAYESRLQNGMTTLNFMKIRVIRLYPMVVLGLLLGLISRLGALYSTTHEIHFVAASVSIVMAFFLGLLLIPCPGAYGLQPHEIFPLDFPLWSLMFELLINFFYGNVARRPKILRTITRVLILCSAITLVLCAVAENGLSGGSSFPTFITGLSRVTFSFFVGVMLNRILTAERLKLMPSVPFPVLASVLLLALFAYPSLGSWYDIAVVFCLFPVLVTLGTKDCISSRWRKVALWAGQVSYPLYILHTVTIHLGHSHVKSTGLTLVEFTGVFVANVTISYCVLKWYDEPLRRHLTKKMRFRKGHPSLVAEAGTTGVD